MDDEDFDDLLATLDEEQPQKPQAIEQQPASLDTQISAELAAVTQIYRKRSETLDQLNLTPQGYTKLVNIIGNNSVIDEEARNQLAGAIGHENTVKVCIGFAENSVLTEADFAEVLEHKSILEELLERQKSLIETYSAQALSECPNMSTIIEPKTVALLRIRFGGSIKQISVTPASNLVNPMSSPLAQDRLIREVPLKYKRQALRILAGKLILAARLDSQQTPPQQSSIASGWLRNIEHRISKLLAPPPALQEHALPKPIDKKPKRRGGKRIRAQKNKLKAGIKPDFVKFGGD